MNRIAFASGFVLGALVMSILFGNQTTTLVHSAVGILFEGFEPVVPPLKGMAIKSNRFLDGSSLALDGAECSDCTFSGNITLLYSGGNFALKDAKFENANVNVELRGAAVNTFILLRYLETLKAAPTPEKFPWQDPKWNINVKQATINMITPIKK
jgi:hypothetical protein